MSSAHFNHTVKFFCFFKHHILHFFKAEAIAKAADDVIAGKFNDWFLVDPIQGGAGTSINMNTNEVIANRALEIIGESKGNYKVISPNSHVNMAQSTNDSFPTAAHLTIAMLLDELIAVMKEMPGIIELPG